MSIIRKHLAPATACTVAILAAVLAPRSAHAVDYTWSSPTTGGLWSGTANWTPNSGANGPTTADTVLLDTTASGTTRTVTITSAANSAVSTLTLTQTNSGTNTLDIGRSTFTVTNAVALGASGGGTARIFLNPQTGTSNVATTFSGGLTVNSGGLLSLGAFNASSGGTNVIANITGNVTVSGGSLILEAYNRQGTNTASQQNLITGSLSMTSGTLVINNSSAGSGGSLNDRRLGTTAGLTITGGVVQTGASLTGGFSIQGVTNTYKPDSVTGGNAYFFLFQGTGANANQSLTSNQIIPTVVARSTGTKSYTSEISGTNLAVLQIGDEDNATPGSRTTFRLGSNLTLQSGKALPAASGNQIQESGRIDLGIDTNGYLLDLTATNAVWAPNFAGTSVTYAVWDLSGSGTMITSGYNFSSSVGTNGAVNVGAGLTLVSRSGTNGVNDLGSGTGTINSTSTFRYSGTATAANPSTLTRAGGALGNLEVTSGALTLLTLSGSAANLAVSGGLLNLGTNSRSVAMATFTGGTVSSGTLTTYSGGYAGGAGFGATAAVSAILSGTGALVHSGSGAIVLSGANVYSGGSTLSAGTVRVAVDNVGTVGAITSGALGTGTLTFAGGGLSSDSTTARTILNPIAFSGDGVVGDATNSGTLTFAAAADLGGATRTLTVASPAQFDGALGGTGGLSKAGAATLTLTASNNYSGGTTISAGTLALGTGGATGSIAGDVTTNATLAFNRSDAVTFGGAIGGTGAVRQEGPGKLTLSASNAYQGGMTVVGTGTLAITNPSALGTGTLTLRTSRSDTLNVFEVGATGTVSNPIVIDMATSGRNNIAVTSGNAAVLGGPISILGTAARTQIFYSDGTGFEVRGNVTGTSFANGLSFRGAGATGIISGTVNAPNAQFEVNGANNASWRVTSTGNTWAVTQIGASGSFIVGANDALATGARVFWFQTPTGGIDLNGFNQTVAGLDSGTTAAGTGRVTNNSASADSTLTLASGTANYEFRGLITDGTNGRKLALAVNVPGRMQTLSGTNSYSGGTTLTAGTIGLGNTSPLGTGTLTFAGASTLQSALATGTFTNAIAISMGVTGTIDTNGNTATFSGPIAGPGGIAKIGSGTLVLSASNTMGSGTLTFGVSSATDLGYVTLANGRALGNYSAVSLTQTGAGTSGINLTGGITTTYDLLSGGRNNAGTTGYILRSLSGSNAWNGNISINNTGGSYGFGADAGATLVIGGTVTTTVSTSARNFQVFGSGTTIVSGRLVGTSSTNSFNVLKNDPGTLILSSSNAYQGNTTLNEGVIAFGNANAFGTGTVLVSNTGGVLRADVNSATIANAMTLNVTGTLDTQANTTTLSGTIGGGGGFVKAGAGTLVLTGSNTYSGGTTINAGTLQIGSDGAAGWIQGNVANGGTLVFRRSDNVTFSGTISGTGGLTKSGAGRVTLTAANTFTGDVTIGSAANSPNYALQLQNSEALGPASAVKRVSVTGDNNTSSTLELAGGITIDANKTLLTSGHSFFQAGSSAQGTPVFLENVSGSNAWLGSVLVNNGGGSYSIESAAGTLVLGAEGTSSVLRNDVASSTRAFDFRGPGTIIVNSRFTTGTTTGAVTGFNMVGTGTLTIARTDNDFGYAPSLSVGTTRIASLADSAVASSLGTGASFNVGGTLEHIGGVSSSSNRTLGLLGASPTIIASGTGTLALTATGAITYQDPTSLLAYTYSSGATTLVARDAAGILPGFTISGTGIAPGTTVTAVNYDTRVITLSQATTASSTSVTLTLGGQTAVPRTFILGGTNAGANVFAARLVDKAAGTAPLSVSKTGAGVWAITGTNGYTGATSVEGGTLRIGNGGTAGSIGTTSGISVTSGALLAFNRTDAYGGFFDRLISGSGDVRVESGFLTLTAANTYTGTTRVLAGGTLAVNGSLANVAMLVDAGAALMGSGTILGDTTIQGSHMPGNSPGIETFTNLTYSGSTASVTWELWGNTVLNAPVAYDQVVVTGNLDFSDPTQLILVFSGTGSGVNWTNSFWDSDRQWVLYDVAGTTTDFLNLSLVVQDWADSAGNLFGTVRGDATFTIVKDTGSADVLLVYAAVPEPGAIALAAAGLGAVAAAWGLRRRRSRKGSEA